MKAKFSVFIAIASLLAIIFLQRECNSPKPGPGSVKRDTIRIVDTVYIQAKIEKTSKPKVKKSIPGKVPDTLKVIDTNYQALLKKYNDLVKAHVAMNIYEDSISLDSLGSLKVIDTLQFNLLGKRQIFANLKIPKIVEKVYVTETRIEPPRRQLYTGIGMYSSKALTGAGANIGILYKTKTDNIYGTTLGINTSGQVLYGIQYYWKISLKK